MKQSFSPANPVFFVGDLITFSLQVDSPAFNGCPILRTNIGGAHRRRLEYLAHRDMPETGQDWRDYKMEPTEKKGVFSLTLPLLEVGCFEAKCCYDLGNGQPLLWAEGDNFRIKVYSAHSRSGNSIYSCFVRQFGRDCALEHSRNTDEQTKNLEKQGYTVIPPSGTFRKVIKELPHLLDDTGCRILLLLPIHPVPVQYGRMGQYGSPFASLDYFNVDPALADFDTKATPMEQFVELIDAVHAKQARIFMDIPVNHTGWASKLQIEHPDYFVRKPDGTFVSPGAWGVTWADLCQLNYQDNKVFDLMAKVFLFWCNRGVDGFRCDAGYMLPVEAWRYIVSRVREEYPDTVFLLEGLGGPLQKQEKLLGEIGLDWAYSELFQCFDRNSIEANYPYMAAQSRNNGILLNFAETHDNLRLAASGQTYAKVRFQVAALLANGAGFGFANGAEYLAQERIDVHGAGALNFGAEPNLLGLISKLNSILSQHPAFAPDSSVELIEEGPDNVIAALRRASNGAEVLVLLNLDCNKPAKVFWPAGRTANLGLELITGLRVSFNCSDAKCSISLAPGQAMAVDVGGNCREIPCLNGEPPAVIEQRAAAMARTAACKMNSPLWKEPDLGRMLLDKPIETLSRIAGKAPGHLTCWRAPEDGKREVMVPAGDLLIFSAPEPFRVKLSSGKRILVGIASIVMRDGVNYAFIVNTFSQFDEPCEVDLSIKTFDKSGKSRHMNGKIMFLPQNSRLKVDYNGLPGKRMAFGSNDLGGYLLCRGRWGELQSKYDALIAANLEDDYPVDRRILFTRLRGFVVTNSYSTELLPEYVENFSAEPDNSALWNFSIPVGQGRRIKLSVAVRFSNTGNAMVMRFERLAVGKKDGMLEDCAPVKLILRPDVENRINHEVTKAYAGPEKEFPNVIRDMERGFSFSPKGARLDVIIDRGRFYENHEWHYMVDLPAERKYGLADKTDLFSPGYFESSLFGGEKTTVRAYASKGGEPSWQEVPQDAFFEPIDDQDKRLVSAMRRFIVRRDGFASVIAGYPWFLDWGRDTLIAVRGLLCNEAFHGDCQAIIRRFAAYEDRGTIPNVICGNQVSNRDTSDAPLYLIIAARDAVLQTHNPSLLDSDCSGRPLREILCSIVKHYQQGTPNGIKVDPASGLVYSPSHFTWMDTNYPAGTPRQGYAIEIQALWYAALKFLGFNDEAEQVHQSIEKLFFPGTGFDMFCSDCLHAANSSVPAAAALADDHNRPNQLLAVTLGAVTDPEKIARILWDSSRLLIPGAIRTLDNCEVDYELPIYHNGRLLNNPKAPYWGTYAGSEDTGRKPAYHNGTAWCWPFPAYCEALFMAGGEEHRQRAMELLLSMRRYLENDVPGEVTEVADGDYPHSAGGCSAQAWSLTEFYRVYTKLLH